LKKAYRMLALVLLAVLAVFALLVWMADGLQTPHASELAPRRIEGVPATTITATQELTIVSWNISWGYGWGSDGSGGFKPREHFDRSLAQMIEVLAKIDPDVVLLQEVDFDCTRSHHQDQAALLAIGARFPYVADAVSWRANWVPFPYWPPRDHYGRMSSGGAILSKHPIASHRIELLPKPEENGFWYNLFYLFRYYQVAEIEFGGDTIPIVNTHLEAFRPKNRELQAKHLASVLSSIDDRDVIVGGDLNAEAEDRTVELIRAVEDLSDTLPADAKTFPSHAPEQKLDFLFHGPGWKLVEARVLKEAGTVSDHLPITVRFARTP
jgi:endonuclease/exonuclease/phosphatase family metal-dependent hydrolase